jgi:pyruvate formate lyase activating enzyme
MDNSQTSEIKGTIFNIQRYSLHDGPGIRTTVFLKGCPLHCSWCCNPESQFSPPQLSFVADKCIHCGKCMETCPYGAVTVTSEGVQTNWKICSETCYRTQPEIFPCTQKCYSKAREKTGNLLTVDTVLSEVMKDAQVYRESGGGLTVSGGEPMMQPLFVKSLAEKAKDNWLHVAMETCGFASWENYESVLEYVDFLFLDIKYFDDAYHRKYTGESNRLILENAPKLADFMRKKGGVMVVRTPVIPGISTPDDVAQIADFVKSNLHGVGTLELMPYHRLGRGKYADIGKMYSLLDLKAPTEDQLKPFQEVVLQRDLTLKYA